VPHSRTVHSGLLVFLLYVVALTGGCRRSINNLTASHSTVSGFWISEISGLSNVLPAGDGRRAWAWSIQGGQTGVYIIDADEPSRRMVVEQLKGADVTGVWRAGDSKHAWVVCKTTNPWDLYLVDINGNASKINLPTEPKDASNPFLSYEVPQDFVWVAPYAVGTGRKEPQRTGLYVADANGRVVRVGEHAFTASKLQYATQVHSLADGSRLLVHDETERFWFVVGADGLDRQINSDLLIGHYLLSSLPVQGTDKTLFQTVVSSNIEFTDSIYAIILRSLSEVRAGKKPRKTDTFRLIALDKEGEGHAIDLEPGVLPNFIGGASSPNGQFVWAVANYGGRTSSYLLNARQELVKKVNVPEPFDTPSPRNERVFPLGNLPKALFSNLSEGEFYFVDSEGNPPTTQTISLGPEFPHKYDWLNASLIRCALAKPEGGAPIILALPGASFSGTRTLLTKIQWGTIKEESAVHSDGGLAWISTSPTSFLVGLEQDVRKAVLRSDTASVSISSGLSGEFSTADQDFSFEMDWPGRDTASKQAPTLGMTIEGDKGLVFSSPLYQLKPNDKSWKFTLPADWSRAIQSSEQYRLVIRYKDDLGTELVFSSPKVTFAHGSFSPLHKKWFRSLMLYAVLVILIGAILKSRANVLTRRALPLTVWALGASTPLLPTIREVFDGPLLIGLLGITSLLALPAALVSPEFFRLIVRAEPFHWLAPFGLMLGKVRGRIYEPYLKELEMQLELARKAANEETYVGLPAVVAWQGNQACDVDPSPADRILDALMSTDATARANVLVQAPGGRGKSALVREITKRAITEFRQNPLKPLPLLCDPRNDKIEENVARALGRHLLLKDQIGPELESGAYVLFFDGVTEAVLKAESVRDYVSGSYGSSSRMLISVRPSEKYRKAIEFSDRCVKVEPLRLNRDTLSLFVSAYSSKDARHGDHRAIEPKTLDACRASDGTYSPILVRFALRFGGSGVDNIADLYRAAFAQLLQAKLEATDDAKGQLFDDVCDLCVNTYWRDQIRALAFSDTTKERRSVLRQLLQADIVLATEAETRGTEPKEVRFFHDSMQSFLTARGLFRSDHSWDALFRAAGAPGFVEAQSDLLTSKGSELFQMCVAVYSPKEKLRKCLCDHIGRWSEKHGDDLTRNNVIQNLPNEILDHPSWKDQPEEGIRTTLLNAVQLCITVDEENRDARNISFLYGGIAPIVWRIPKSQDGFEFGA
jgi:hypothetical protein